MDRELMLLHLQELLLDRYRGVTVKEFVLNVAIAHLTFLRPPPSPS